MFIRGQSYVRRDIHAELRGQAQGGISTPTKHPIILLFTGKQGEQNGYRDGWTEDGVFLYTREGQLGNMEFIRGNRAVRDHISDGKDLLLFEYVDHGRVRYLGQMVYAGFNKREITDLDGNIRSAIVFHLLPLDSFDRMVHTQDDIDNQFSKTSMEELRRKAIEEAQDQRPPHESKQSTYFRSSVIRAYVLRRAAGICEACGQVAPFMTSSGNPYLEPHHIQRISDGGPDHPEWVASVCPNCHCRAHYSEDKDQFNKKLRNIILEKERKMQLDP